MIPVLANLARFLPHLIAVAALGGLVWGYGHSRYNAGYNTAEARMQRLVAVANARVVAKDQSYLASSRALAKQLADVLSRPSKTIIESRTLVREVPSESGTCPDFDSAFKLCFDAIAAGNPGACSTNSVPAATDVGALPTPGVVQ